MANIGWNGSVISFGNGSVMPLTDLHQPNEPAEFDTTGSVDTTHLKGTGLPKNSFNCSFLGSLVPAAATCCAVAATIKPSVTPKTYPQAILTQVSVNGRKDGRIEGSATIMPGDVSLTPTAHAWNQNPGDLGFNGSSFSFAETPFTGLVSASYQASAQPIESVGAEGPPAENLYVPGLPDETLTIVCLGLPQCQAKATGATQMRWNDGGTVGSSGGSYTAECMSTRPGGSLDGQTTTEYVFKMTRSAGGND